MPHFVAQFILAEEVEHSRKVWLRTNPHGSITAVVILPLFDGVRGHQLPLTP